MVWHNPLGLKTEFSKDLTQVPNFLYCVFTPMNTQKIDPQVLAPKFTQREIEELDRLARWLIESGEPPHVFDLLAGPSVSRLRQDYQEARRLFQNLSLD